MVRMKLPEKICPHEPLAGYRRSLKRVLRRNRRKLDKLACRGIPVVTKDRYRGWSI